MAETWLRYGLDKVQICVKYICDTCEIWLRYGWYIAEIWLRYGWYMWYNLSEICRRYIWDMFKLNMKLNLRYLQLCVKYHERDQKDTWLRYAWNILKSAGDMFEICLGYDLDLLDNCLNYSKFWLIFAWDMPNICLR